MEMLEHVPDPASVVRACSQLVKPGGWVFFSTINRNPKSFLFAIVGAEYLLNLLPRGTHEYLKFIRPSELAAYCSRRRARAGAHPGHGIQPAHPPLLAVGRHRRELHVRHAKGLMFSDIRAVLFDLDGTLIDSAPDLGAAADKMRIARGLPSLPLERYRPMAGAGARGMLGVAFGITPEHPDYAALREEFFVNYENCMTERTYVFQGIAELIAQLLGQGLAWGVVTNKSMRFTQPLTQRMSLFATARPWSAATARPTPSRIRRRCWKQPGSCGWRRPAASTWAMTSAMWRRAWPPAWVRWPPPTAISAVTPTPSCGGPMPTSIPRLICCRS